MKEKKKPITEMEKLTAGYEKLIKTKQVNKNGKMLFDETLKNLAN